MRTVRLDGVIANFVKRVKKVKRYGGNGMISRVVSKSLGSFLSKPKECFSCKYHREQVADLELKRQQMAPIEEVPCAWVMCDDGLLDEANLFAVRYRRPPKQVIEQAILEHLTRPLECDYCSSRGPK